LDKGVNVDGNLTQLFVGVFVQKRWDIVAECIEQFIAPTNKISKFDDLIFDQIYTYLLMKKKLYYC
jgi:hypothetical protein